MGKLKSELTEEEWLRRTLAKRLYYKRNSKRLINLSTKWKQNNRDRVHSWSRESRFKLKLEVLSHYSGSNPPQCINPYGQHKEPYIDLRALSLDLIKGGHHKSGLPSGGETLYRVLKKNDYPEGWQVLCMNCQWVKRSENAEVGTHL